MEKGEKTTRHWSEDSKNKITGKSHDRRRTNHRKDHSCKVRSAITKPARRRGGGVKRLKENHRTHLERKEKKVTRDEKKRGGGKETKEAPDRSKKEESALSTGKKGQKDGEAQKQDLSNAQRRTGKPRGRKERKGLEKSWKKGGANVGGWGYLTVIREEERD